MEFSGRKLPVAADAVAVAVAILHKPLMRNAHLAVAAVVATAVADAAAPAKKKLLESFGTQGKSLLGLGGFKHLRLHLTDTTASRLLLCSKAPLAATATAAAGIW